jgi:lipopolysaccharide transport system permease protein
MSLVVVQELWEYRDLFYFLAWRDIKIRYRQTALGAAWAILQPLLATGVFTALFGRVAKMPSDGIPYALFAFSAMLPWAFFSTSLNTASNSLVGNSQLIRKVYFPRMALPGAAVLACMVDFVTSSVVLFALMAYYHVSVSWKFLFWPLLLVELIALTTGLSFILGALNVRYRDVKQALPFSIQILFFLTPVIYPISMIPKRYRILISLNPLSGIVETMRSTLFPGRPVDWPLFVTSLILTLAIFAVGAMYFRSAERAFADMI